MRFGAHPSSDPGPRVVTLRRNGARRSAAGFSLIELLVALSIVVLLAALLLPTVWMARSVANLTKCSSNIRMLSAGLQAYIGDNDGLYPYFDADSPTALGWTGRVGPFLDDTYSSTNYMGNNNYHCPFAEKEIANQWLFTTRFSYQYSMNSNLEALLGSQWGGWFQGKQPTSAAQVCSQTVQLCDGGVALFNGMVYFGERTSASGGTWQLAGSVCNPPVAANPPPAQRAIVQHRGRVTMSYVDGHVGTITPTWGLSEMTTAFNLKQ